MSVRAIEAEVSIKSGVQAECTIGREVVVEVHEDVNLESLEVTANGTYEPSEGIDGYDRVVVDVPPTIPDISPLTVTEDGVYQSSGDGYNPVTVNTGVDALRQEIASAETASGCDPLVDGLTALKTYANEVTGQDDTTLSDAVGTLVSGYGKSQNLNVFAHATGTKLAGLFQNMTLPETVIIDFEGNSEITSLANTFRNSGYKYITFKNLESTCNFTACVYTPTVKTITFENCDGFKPTYIQFVNDSELEAVYGEIDMSACTGAIDALIFGCPKLHTVRFKPNTIGVTLRRLLNYSYMVSDESLISIANALRADVPCSITAYSQSKQNISAVIGNNDNGTFVADTNGSMTLMDFITTVKGWTVT